LVVATPVGMGGVVGVGVGMGVGVGGDAAVAVLDFGCTVEIEPPLYQSLTSLPSLYQS